jgi:pimeloyl-ACP methyl ester carboxylesterase
MRAYGIDRSASGGAAAVSERFVLLQGSWHGGWAWEPTAWYLRELGHEAFTPTYPGHFAGANRKGIRHDDYVTAVVSFIEGRDLRDVVLVGHSFGGSVVSRVSQVIPPRLKRLVFHTAFVVRDGASVNDEFPHEQAVQFEQAARRALTTRSSALGKPFATCSSRTPRPSRRDRYGSVWSATFAPWAEKLNLQEFHQGEVPGSYIAVTGDRALPPGRGHPDMPRGWEPSSWSRWTAVRTAEQKTLLETEALAHEEIGEEEEPLDVGARVADELEPSGDEVTIERHPEA